MLREKYESEFNSLKAQLKKYRHQELESPRQHSRSPSRRHLTPSRGSPDREEYTSKLDKDAEIRKLKDDIRRLENINSQLVKVKEEYMEKAKRAQEKVHQLESLQIYVEQIWQ